MTVPGHLAGAYLAIQLVNYIDPNLNLNKPSVLIVGVLSGVAIDLDAALYIGRLRDHHDTPTHTPLFWLAAFLVLFGLNHIFGWSVQSYIAASFVAVASHLFLDWYGGRIAGLRAFYPLSKKRYSLYPLQRDVALFNFKDDFGKEYWEYYFSNKFLVFSEAALIVSAVTIFIVKLMNS